jgi:DNA-binding protein WhiA
VTGKEDSELLLSFSSEVRREIARAELSSACCCRAEFAAFTALFGETESRADGSGRLWLKADSLYIARRLFKSGKNFGLKPELEFKPGGDKQRLARVSAALTPAQAGQLARFKPEDPEFPGLFRKKCCQKTLLRAAFLGKGSVNHPANSYHMEMIVSSPELAGVIRSALNQNGLPARMVKRRGHYRLYVKDSETVSDFLRFIGAHQAVLAFENVRVVKAVKNQVNRQVNCETANLSKVVQAATRQTDLLERLVDAVGIAGTPVEYRELIRLRLREKESSLQELGYLMEPKLSKSGVAYRMRKIETYARKVLSRP